MVATLKAIGNVKDTLVYFYMTESNKELAKGFYINDTVKSLGLKKLGKESLERVLSGRLGKGIELGRIEKGKRVHHRGQELILSAPKSISILALALGKKEVLNAHEKAVSSTLGYVERNVIYYRVQREGNKELLKSDNSIIAKFTHNSSRSVRGEVPDPQLHTHCLIGNVTKCSDGKYRSVVFDELYKSKMNIGEIYRNELAKNIRELGFEVGIYKEKGRMMFEVKGVPKSVIDEFSKRRVQILEFAKSRGIEDAKGLAYAAKVTREDKSHFENIEKIWKERCKSFDVPKSLHSYNTESLDEIIKSSVEQLSERESAWNYRDLHKVLIQKNRARYSFESIEKKIEEYVKKGSIIKLDKESYSETSLRDDSVTPRLCRSNYTSLGRSLSTRKAETLYTSKENVNIEKNIISLMREGQGKVSQVAQSIKFPKNTKLSQEQQEAIKLVLSSKDRVVGI